MSETTPFKVVTGTKITPKQPFAHLYQHVRQRDPKLAETIDKLAQPESLSSNLANPLQVLTFRMSSPSEGDATPWPSVMSNVPTDTTQYLPLVAYATVRVLSTVDVTVDIQVSHDGGNNFTSIFNAGLTIPAGSHVSQQIVSFAPGAYFRNLDIVQGVCLTSGFNGTDIEWQVLFQ